MRKIKRVVARRKNNTKVTWQAIERTSGHYEPSRHTWVVNIEVIGHTCSYCGSPVETYWSFCPFCGKEAIK